MMKETAERIPSSLSLKLTLQKSAKIDDVTG